MLGASAAKQRRGSATKMGMGGLLVAVLVVLASASGFVDATVAVAERTPATQWGRVAAEFFNMNVVCGQCDDLCPKSPYVTPEESRKAAALHWACYIGCRTTCLLQMGPDKFEYETSKNLCIKGCHDEYKSTPENDNVFSRACVEACSGKVVSPKMTPADLSRAYAQLDIEETETILFDPSIDIKNGGLSRSSYKTIPRKDSLGMYTNIKRRLAGKTSLEHVLTFFKDPSTDPVLAGAIAIPLFLALFGLMCYLMYVVSLAKRARKVRIIRIRREAREARQAQQHARNVLRVQLESDDKKVLLSSDSSEDDFVPPPSPPPKYSDIVQTV